VEAEARRSRHRRGADDVRVDRLHVTRGGGEKRRVEQVRPLRRWRQWRLCLCLCLDCALKLARTHARGGGPWRHVIAVLDDVVVASHGVVAVLIQDRDSAR
jgi:hypothetical protein